jgi:SAM-dependent methyltransferase
LIFDEPTRRRAFTIPWGSKEVQDFYERYPYPRPIDSLEKYRRLGQDRQKRRADYHLFWPGRPYREDQSILIAGCGTSQAAKHALRWPAAQVTGIDFSAISVRCTEELKRKYDLRNLQVRQLPIERVSDLKMSFDQIVCTGFSIIYRIPMRGSAPCAAC